MKTELQRFFEQSVTGLLKQGRASFDKEAVSCMYRGTEDTKCAIGMCISDEGYNLQIESDCSIKVNSLALEALTKSGWSSDITDDTNMLDDLQHIHDLVDVVEWKPMFIKFGNLYGLDVSFITSPAG